MLTVLRDFFSVFGRSARRRLGLLAFATAVVAVLEGASVDVPVLQRDRAALTRKTPPFWGNMMSVVYRMCGSQR